MHLLLQRLLQRCVPASLLHLHKQQQSSPASSHQLQTVYGVHCCGHSLGKCCCCRACERCCLLAATRDCCCCRTCWWVQELAQLSEAQQQLAPTEHLQPLAAAEKERQRMQAGVADVASVCEGGLAGPSALLPVQLHAVSDAVPTWSPATNQVQIAATSGGQIAPGQPLSVTRHHQRWLVRRATVRVDRAANCCMQLDIDSLPDRL